METASCSAHNSTSALRRLAQDGADPDRAPPVGRDGDVHRAGHARSGGRRAIGRLPAHRGYEGSARRVEATRSEVDAVLDELGGARLPAAPGQAWATGRYRGLYLRDSLLDAGVLVETVETAAFWSNLGNVYTQVPTALSAALRASGTPPLVLCHISHVYPTGASLYFTVVARQASDPVDQAGIRPGRPVALGEGRRDDGHGGATITHHHGVGRDHRPWLEAEIGSVGVEILRAVKSRLDPAGVLNPGVLVP